MKKKIVSLLMAAMMTINTLPMNVFATTFGSVEETPAEVHEEIVEEEEDKKIVKEELDFSGKTLSILGASISTFAGSSNGAAAETTNSTIKKNAIYYPNSTIPEVTLHDTWWKQVEQDLGMRLLVNNAWSGSAILLERSGTVGAYVDRCVQLHDNTGENAGEEPDIICIQMGFNDFSYGKATLGTSDIDYETLITAEGYGTPTTTMEATAIMLDKMTKRYPNAEIYMFNHFKRIGQSASDTVLMEQLNESIGDVCSRFDVKVVDLYSVLNESRFIGDGRLHPNRLGMDVISEAVKRTIIENTDYSVNDHTVSFDLDDVTADYSADKIVLDGSPFICNLTAASGYTPSVTVTMGGKDITADSYADGVISIEAVTGDVVITAKAVISEHEPQTYRWEFDGSELATVGIVENVLTKGSGTTTDGVFNKTRYQLDTAVYLLHNQPWSVEWKSSGTWRNSSSSSGGRLFTTTPINADYNARYIFKSANSYLIAMGEKDTAGSHNYGIALSDHGINGSEVHTYRLTNRIADDGSNMIYLYVDGVEIDAMNHYYIGSNSQNTTSDWLAGKDFIFPYIGTDTHGLTNCSIEYLQIWEGGHSHSYTSEITPPTCTEKGYTTYTCTCGESYVGEYVDATGHSYTNGICTSCADVYIEWEIGTIAAANGQNTSNQTRIRTRDYLVLSDFAGITVNVGYNLTWLAYDADMNYIGNGTTTFTGYWQASGQSIAIADIQSFYSDAMYFRIAMKTVSGNQMTLTDVESSGVNFLAVGEELPEPDYELDYDSLGNIGFWQDGAICDDHGPRWP